jgi:hypothetical protein
MSDRDLMQQALDAMMTIRPYEVVDYDQLEASITALRERLAQPEMEPCAGRNCGSTNPNLHSAECFEDYEKSTGMNQWQGLTDEERNSLWRDVVGWGDPSHDDEDLMKAIEAKLKEKNNG